MRMLKKSLQSIYLWYLYGIHLIPFFSDCKREKRNYEDGTKIKVDCNGCTCSCGKWICTSKLCQEEHLFNKEDVSENDFYNYADMDNIF